MGGPRVEEAATPLGLLNGASPDTVPPDTHLGEAPGDNPLPEKAELQAPQAVTIHYLVRPTMAG